MRRVSVRIRGKHDTIRLTVNSVGHRCACRCGSRRYRRRHHEQDRYLFCRCPRCAWSVFRWDQNGKPRVLVGQLGINPATGELAEGVCAQAEQSLANIETLLNEAGATTGNVVKTTVFLADIDDFKAVNEVYAKHFEAPFPARSAIQVAAIPAGALVEIEVIASVQ